MGTPDRPLRVAHLVGSNEPLESFRRFAEHSHPERTTQLIGSLDRAGHLQQGLRRAGFETFALGVETRRAYPQATLGFARWLHRQQIDVLQTHLFEACLVGLTAGRIARVPVTIFTAHHSHEIPLHERRLLTCLDRFAAGPLASRVIAPSAAMRSVLIEHHHLRPEKIRVIHHGTDLTMFDPRHGARSAFRRQLGLGDGVVFGAVSRYFWVKNLEGLLTAFAEMLHDEPDAKLVVVGGGDPAPLERIVRQRGLGPSVRLLGSVDSVRDAYSAFDVFVHPSFAESFGQVIIEAMAMEKPIVTTPVGVVTDVIDDGSTGFVSAGFDPPALVTAMRRALAAREQWGSMGAAARRRALQFTPEAWVGEHEDAYLTWFEQTRRGRGRRAEAKESL